jgi:hypothetical protein
MLTKSKIAVIAAVLGMVSASPAFAQSFNRPEGSGNSLPSHYDSQGGLHCDRLAACTGIPPQQIRIATRRSGLNAFASIWRAGFASDAPSSTGGGSVGATLRR